ncbi:DUF2442 domain-containing protein [Sphingomonas taxi]|jgi:hypothetical protein|uniref:DUF2442 domain-containing protein n=1 Tax=Sphingomonas taxi TaxID=1549858 RepID=UPI0009DEB2C2|nr:DUF2442 domain-containing protein [Sphingomonas taxi]
MVELTDEEFEAARERGRALFETEPHAKAVRHDLKSGMTVVELYNGCTFAFPPRRLQGLENASDQDLLAVEVNGLGYGLHWEALDADYTVGGLMAGRFGTPAFMERERARLRAILDNDPRYHAA